MFRLLALAALVGVLLSVQSTAAPPARADDQLHDVTYILQFDGWVPGTVATFMLTDTQTNSANLNVPPFQPFEAHAQLADPAKAGIQVRMRFPSETTVHCEIQVDNIVAVKRSQYVRTWWQNDTKPDTGVMRCGAPIPGYA